MNSTIVSFYTDQGPREGVEDRAAAIQLRGLPAATEVTIAGVFDGVGGRNYGEVASDLAARVTLSFLTAYYAGLDERHVEKDMSPDATLAILKKALETANHTILQQITEQPLLKGMATTAVCALIINEMLYVAWVGDSRCYLYGEKGIRRITVDHSAVQVLIDAGKIDAEQAKSHPLAHTINRFLGQPKSFQVDTRLCHLSPGDVIILCTDGLTDVVPEQDIAACAGTYQHEPGLFDGLPQALVQRALEAETHDNVTVLGCQYRAASPSESLGLTLTGEYPVILAQTLHNRFKECSHDYDK